VRTLAHYQLKRSELGVSSGLVRDIDRILVDHRVDLPKANINAALAWLLSGSCGDAIGGATSP